MTRTVLITGSAGPLGRALRDAFEAEGDRVIGVDLPGSGADICVDLRDAPLGLPNHAAILAERDYGPIDVVVNNAKLDGWRHAAIMGDIATSAIINIGSIYGLLGNDPKMYEGTEVEPTPVWYSASKGALIALTKWQATNLAPVRSNCVCPGGISRAHSAVFRERYNSKVPLRRMATEADIVPLVLFLASEKASYITGQVICVDGGYSAW